MEPKTTLPPRVLDALGSVHAQALQPTALDRKTKELVALAAALSTGNETSIAYHLHNVLEAGAVRAEIVEAVEVAVVTLGEPAVVHAAGILRALDLDAAARFAEETSTLRTHAAAHPYMPPD